MATILFIDRQDLVENSIVDGNVDTDKFMMFVKIAQEMNVRNYLGTDLYNKLQLLIDNDTIASYPDYKYILDEFIQPMLIHFTMAEYLPWSSYQVKNNGVFKHTSEFAELPSKSEIDFLVNKERSYAEYWTRRFIDHMAFNQSKFPEYNTNSNDDIYPDRDATFQGWVL